MGFNDDPSPAGANPYSSRTKHLQSPKYTIMVGRQKISKAKPAQNKTIPKSKSARTKATRLARATEPQLPVQYISKEETPNLLPPIDGPALYPFRFKSPESSIKWIERIDTKKQGGGDVGSYIYRAEIDGKIYAIKVFKFYDPMANDEYWQPLFADTMSLNDIAYYLDPFYSECRAYGRIKACTQKKKMPSGLVVPCYGYILLNGTDEAYLKHQGMDLAIQNRRYQNTATEGLKVRAIVKEYVESRDSGLNGKSLRRIIRDIGYLNGRAKVYNRDIRLANFVDGRLVDFGCAWTEPHAFLDVIGQWNSRRCRMGDKWDFDEMVEEKNISNPKNIKAAHSMSLRSADVSGEQDC